METINSVIIAGSSSFNYHIGGLFEKILPDQVTIGSVRPDKLLTSIQKDKFDIIVTEETGHASHSLIQQVRLISSKTKIILFTQTGKADCPADLILPVKISSQVRSKLQNFLRNPVSHYINDNSVEKFSSQKIVQLTVRQLEIFEGIWNNLSNAQMADKLFISERTIEGHRKDLYRLTGSTTIQDIMKFGYIQKWCDEKAVLNQKFYTFLNGTQECYVTIDCALVGVARWLVNGDTNK